MFKKPKLPITLIRNFSDLLRIHETCKLRNYAFYSIHHTHVPTRLNCELLVLGGGAGGCSVASKFASKLDKNHVIIVEPSDVHYYQPMLTLVGGGIKKVSDAARPMRNILPAGAHWVKDSVISFEPANNIVRTKEGISISYDYLLVALGLELRFDLVEGLQEALANPDSGVSSNYSPQFAGRTFENLKKFDKGNAIFTFPNTPVKCAGAPQKACYISEDYLQKHGKRESANVMYKTSLPVIFGVKHYADALNELCKRRNIDVGLRQELIEIDVGKKEAIFCNLDKKDDTFEIPYTMLHVTPPMSAPESLRNDKILSDSTGFLNVDKLTLQHPKFPNIFGIGDCTNLPTSKTAAAVAAQSKVVFNNITHVMRGEEPKATYDGYTSCPLVTGYGSCILAEFDYNAQPLETFPIDQRKESALMYYLKKDVMPSLYWFGLLKGIWNGPEHFRKLFHFGAAK
ncbi:sulfide:quinone oxidoreductase, mitochondrial isoform X1 [Nilaparvata lugens]|uniref:sulfide:quinone oxidoreductase, mitochondrial isoform X1 n=1 Tax=Nilaparvata lugens TaxID=108931 RepID=UPI00193EA2B2|nr:sulfide:quinone oxidoreductase, mitochondrial isoform X1 [Nilaparvata lugens]